MTQKVTASTGNEKKILVSERLPTIYIRTSPKEGWNESCTYAGHPSVVCTAKSVNIANATSSK